MVTDQSVDALLDLVPMPTEEDFAKKPTGPRHVLHDGKLVTIGSDERICDYLQQLNIPPARGLAGSHKRVKSGAAPPSRRTSVAEPPASIPRPARQEVPASPREPRKDETADIRPPLSYVTLLDPLHGLDWLEEISYTSAPKRPLAPEISDGMAALSLRPEGKGYFGMASTAETVRSLDIHDEPNTMPVLASSAPSQSTLVDLEQEDIEKESVMTSELENRYVDAYFEHYHTLYPFVHKKTFFEHYEHPERIPAGLRKSFDILKLVVCALGCWCISHKDSTTDLKIYKAARELLGLYVFEHGNLFLTISLTLILNYIQKRDFPNTGWAYLGTLVRHALGLALHVPIKGATPLEQEIRNRVWWGLYIFDVGTAITWGRPIHLPNLDEVKIEIIKNIPDEIWDSSDETMDLSERDYPTIYSGFIAQIRFTHVLSAIYNRTLSKKKLPLKECLGLNKDIEDFVASLPDYLSFDDTVFHAALQKHYFLKNATPPKWLYLTRYRLCWRTRNLQVVLFKLLILNKKSGLFVKEDSTVMFDSISLCLEALRQTIQSVTEYYHLIDPKKTQRLALWYAIYFAFQAIVIPMFCLLKEPSLKFVNQWVHGLHSLRLVLQGLSDKNALCTKFIKLIDKTVEKYNDLLLLGSSSRTGLAGENRAPKRRLSLDQDRPLSVGSIGIIELKKKPEDQPQERTMMILAAQSFNMHMGQGMGLNNPNYEQPNEKRASAVLYLQSKPAFPFNRPPYPVKQEQELNQIHQQFKQFQQNLFGNQQVVPSMPMPVMPMPIVGPSNGYPQYQQQPMVQPMPYGLQGVPNMGANMAPGMQNMVPGNMAVKNEPRDNSNAVNTLAGLFESEDVDFVTYGYGLNIESFNEFEFSVDRQ